MPRRRGGTWLTFRSPDEDRPRGWGLEAGKHHQAGGLAGSGRAEKREELALRDREVEVAYDLGLPVEALRDPVEPHMCRAVGCATPQREPAESVPWRRGSRSGAGLGHPRSSSRVGPPAVDFRLPGLQGSVPGPDAGARRAGSGAGRSGPVVCRSAQVHEMRPAGSRIQWTSQGAGARERYRAPERVARLGFSPRGAASLAAPPSLNRRHRSPPDRTARSAPLG